MIIGNYGGHWLMPLSHFVWLYPLEFVNKKDPAMMTFRNQDNHPVTFMGMEMIICQLLMHGTARSVSM